MSEHANNPSHTPHVTPLWIYWAVAAALFTLTGVTVAVSFIDFNHLLGFPGMNLIIAMLVATLKGTLVCLFFMHLLHDSKLYSFALLSGLAALAIFIILTMLDTERRGDINEIVAKPIKAQVEYKEPAHRPEH